MYDYLAGRDQISNFHASSFLFPTNYIAFKLPATTLYIIDNLYIYINDQLEIVAAWLNIGQRLK